MLRMQLVHSHIPAQFQYPQSPSISTAGVAFSTRGLGGNALESKLLVQIWVLPLAWRPWESKLTFLKLSPSWL